MSDGTSARLALPLMQAGQSQKEVTHNEALATIDLVLQASVLSVGDDAPPAAPGPGECWIVGAAPTGDWAGHAGAIAGWTDGGWRFAAPVEGMVAWNAADAGTVRHSGGQWSNGVLPAIADPAGGSVIDEPARSATAAILAALRSHGLIAD